MKFSHLLNTHRSALAALVNSGPLRTDRLAKVMQSASVPQAAHSLCQMRRIGLVFSKEKGTNNYAEWEATDVGRAVFEGRPDDVQLVDKVSPVNACASGKQATAYAVVPDTGFPVGSYDDALACAKAAAIGHGKPYVVVALVAEVLPPVAPQPVVNVL